MCEIWYGKLNWLVKCKNDPSKCVQNWVGNFKHQKKKKKIDSEVKIKLTIS